MAGVGYAFRNENTYLFQEKKEYEDCVAANCRGYFSRRVTHPPSSGSKATRFNMYKQVRLGILKLMKVDIPT